MSFTVNISNACATKYDIEDGKTRHEFVKLDSVSDLRVRFDSKLNFFDHMNEKINKACSILGVFKRNVIYIYNFLMTCHKDWIFIRLAVTVNCILASKSVIHKIVLLLISYECNLLIKRLRGTLSKAF